MYPSNLKLQGSIDSTTWPETAIVAMDIVGDGRMRIKPHLWSVSHLKRIEIKAKMLSLGWSHQSCQSDHYLCHQYYFCHS